MKQLLILSGKGGTGKTTLASAFIKLAEVKACADCDVDAPNLHLVMEQAVKPQIADYYGMDKAFIDKKQCTECGICEDYCRFNAINFKEGSYEIDYYGCEGCGVCEKICPFDAISMQADIAGELKLYANDKVFSTAQLKMGSGNSGKLVTEVKNQMKMAASGVELAIIDGSPGIGCPVIASLSGVDMVLIVAEPSLSGISDLQRILRTAAKFQTKCLVCINKYDTNLDNSQKIEELCDGLNIPMVGKVPFDVEAIKAVNNGHSIVEIDCLAGKAAKEVYTKTIEELNNMKCIIN